MTTSNKTKIRVESAEAVLGLHWFVARDYTAAEEGLEIEILLPRNRTTRFSEGDPRIFDHALVKSTNYQDLFETRQVDVYRACQWGQIRRATDNPRGPIVSKRAAVVCQGIFVPPESSVNAPTELADKTVGVQFHQGSHYCTLQMLEGCLRRDQIKVVHMGTVAERYEALVNREVDAVTLMEPWITLAEKNGYKHLIETHYLGVENAPRDLDTAIWDAAQRAIRKAVRLINQEPRKYLHYLIEEIPEKYARQLTPNDFHLSRFRYVDPQPYSQEEFEKEHEWMLRWDLVRPDATYDEVVANR